MQKSLNIKYPEEILLSLKETEEEFARRVPFLTALKLFEIGKLSSGLAAKLSGMSRVDFLYEIGKYKVSIFQIQHQEIKEDLKNA